MENTEQTLMTLEERLLKEGKIKAFRIGRIWKIPRASLAEYLKINGCCKVG